MLIAVLFIVAAVAVLYFGAEISLNASEVLGKKLGLSPLVIGMLIIGLGTSLPEFFVAHIASSQGKGAMALGTLIGSNIANLSLVLSIGGLISILKLSGKGIRNQLLIHLVLSISLIFVLTQIELGLLSAVILFSICIAYLFMIFFDLKKEKILKEEVGGHLLTLTLKTIFGFGLLYVGGELLVKGGVRLGSVIGLSDYIVSSIFLAFGTSFPELITVILSAVKRKDTDLIVGNIIGSNLFNCALILGSLGFYNLTIEGDYRVELFALVAISFFLFVSSLVKKNFFRFSAIIFLSIYCVVVLKWVGFFEEYLI